ncbi:MAG TPA: NADH-quinone oxidoreductase subunit C [Dehalococcoidales bacterium]|nr:NADH-quinone oxidoreductase subunit C [Dehalococcoidales bacterium]
MTTSLSTREIAGQISERLPDAVIDAAGTAILVNSNSLLDVGAFLKNTPGLDFDYLTTITAVDYYQYFEVVYLFVSMEHNHSLVIKTRCQGRDNLTLPSLVGLWRSADHQEREIYDLMGITFEGHPNMKRIVLWSDFQGHPQRKDFM